MTVRELYRWMNEKISAALSCEWDNDGLLCCPDGEREVRRVLVALDVTDAVVTRAIEGGFDLILTHHPMIFKGLKAVNDESPAAAKVIRLIRAGISVMSFHTRLDALEGGVNDCLAARLELLEVAPFGGEGLGRMGRLSAPMSAEAFARFLKEKLNAPSVVYADAGQPVSRVALLGGAGEDEIGEAMAEGADSYVTGEAKYHILTDAPEEGINLFAAGHYYTEFPVCEALCRMIQAIDPLLSCEIVDSTVLRVI